MEGQGSIRMDTLGSVSTVVSPTSSSPRVPDGWSIHVHPEGWIYFSNPSLRVVTQDDIRQPDHYRNMSHACSMLPMDELDALGLEVQVLCLDDKNYLNFYFRYLPGQSGGFGAFNLYIDHQHCLASYSISEVKEHSQMDIDMRRNPFLSSLAGLTCALRN